MSPALATPPPMITNDGLKKLTIAAIVWPIESSGLAQDLVCDEITVRCSVGNVTAP